MPLNLSGLPNVPMRIITLVLVVLASWASLSSNWIGESYLLANYFVVLLGLWAERDAPSPVPVQFFFFGMIFTFVNDILSVSISYSTYNDLTKSPYSALKRSTFQFNAAMAIILILAKPIACLFIYKEWQTRVDGGQEGGSNYEQLGGNQRGGYQEYGGYNEKAEHPPQYQPPNQPFP
ncbi:uncharacterized protein LOC130641000 [Hydractinia symbiolongicarpus]|uniref:uncharacterized protein LOC130641000 n=1 Tax=Hydractinia symbiolongicarpus TaxID=13093 RepID=UPI0025501DD5|nr:uncharacterized protein LOC130641000 [Hydractinia symbiolongicarpus]